MKQYVTSICIFTTSLIFLLAICVLSCSAKMTSYLVEQRESIVVVRGVEGLDLAKKSIEKDMREKVQRMVEPRAYSHEKAKQDFGYSPLEFKDGVKDEIELYKKSKLKSK